MAPPSASNQWVWVRGLFTVAPDVLTLILRQGVAAIDGIITNNNVHTLLGFLKAATTQIVDYSVPVVSIHTSDACFVIDRGFIDHIDRWERNEATVCKF